MHPQLKATYVTRERSAAYGYEHILKNSRHEIYKRPRTKAKTMATNQLNPLRYPTITETRNALIAHSNDEYVSLLSCLSSDAYMIEGYRRAHRQIAQLRYSDPQHKSTIKNLVIPNATSAFVRSVAEGKPDFACRYEADFLDFYVRDQ